MLHAVAGSVHALRSVRIANTWLLSDAQGRRFLIDTGHRAERRGLVADLRRAGVRGPGDLEAILLTHRHSDHAGNAAFLRERFRCPVVAHEDDAAILEEHAPRTPLAGRGAPHVHGLLCRIEDRYPARSKVDDTFEEGASRWGFVAVPAAGHTEGSVLLLHEPTGALFSGDAILAGFPVQRFRASLKLAVPEYSLDAPACHRAVRAFLRSDPDVRILCAGHGPILRKNVRRRLASLA